MNLQGGEPHNFANQPQMGAASQPGFMGQPSLNMMPTGQPAQGIMPQHSGLYQSTGNGANGNGTGNNQMMQMGYMHDGPGQYMMPHGQAGSGQLPAGDSGVPHMGGALGEGQGQMQNMGGAPGQQAYGNGENFN